MIIFFLAFAFRVFAIVLETSILADLDRRNMPWQKFFFVNIEYQPFDAAGWSLLPSSLLGPVRLTPMRELHDL